MHVTAPHHPPAWIAGGRSRLARGERAVVVVCALVMGVGALFGGWGLLSDAQGLGVEESWLRWPFSDYTVPGLFLLVVIGGGMLATAALALRQAATARLAALALGAVLLAWLAIESAVIGYRGGEQLALLAVCGACGVALAGVGLRRQRPPA